MWMGIERSSCSFPEAIATSVHGKSSKSQTHNNNVNIKNFRTAITQNLVFVKDFQKTDARVTGFEELSHF